MKWSSIIWLIVAIIIVVLGLWYWSSMGQQSSNNANVVSQPSTMTPPATTTLIITVVLNVARTNELGAYLVALNGMTLYYPNQPGLSDCLSHLDWCAAIWLPYTIPESEASSSLGGGPGVTGRVGTIIRSDGTSQVTYNNVPLYFYSRDKNVGDTTGYSIGGLWLVANP